ncbi:hypothetical protein HBI82_174340 [Parastagonospora nodorum]|nr:hypothetical protein HBH95_179340 [Parastagonospora nodorum]KAH5609903.1 hypothetical protein HBI45_073700 [Parastagonospora nodorum]KAH5996277.1 hypothetical protein HBI82_174340 [Parastagonospora nodorum]
MHSKPDCCANDYPGPCKFAPGLVHFRYNFRDVVTKCSNIASHSRAVALKSWAVHAWAEARNDRRSQPGYLFWGVLTDRSEQCFVLSLIENQRRDASLKSVSAKLHGRKGQHAKNEASADGNELHGVLQEASAFIVPNVIFVNANGCKKAESQFEKFWLWMNKKGRRCGVWCPVVDCDFLLWTVISCCGL